MPAAATARPFWPVTLRALRDLARLALAALVLALSVGAVEVDTAEVRATATAETARPGVVVSRVAELSPTSRPVAETPAERPLPVRPATVPAAPASVPPATPAAPGDPVRDATGLRGPPRR
ncbi:hypothetical protein [Micromonospora psammae]|uniref:hypothetical protein n=1 Tax=Micromonospora sp. CPCC 205556 TaxID=3122398 RepID=UPI002FEF1101